MEFRTITDITPPRKRIDTGARILSIGSCFAANMAVKLSDGGFDVCSNPFGVLYNPASIAEGFGILRTGREFRHDDLVLNGELWCSPLFHGSFSSPDPHEALEAMNRQVRLGHQALDAADFVVISLGTPWVYTVSDEFAAAGCPLPTGSAVANCHKFPGDYYTRRRMDIEEAARALGELSVLENKQVILTVSPVRYPGDGLHGNTLGKAILHLAAERICSDRANWYYFPAYEALVDDLRDYRFYDRDMTHPSADAIEYIWELFTGNVLTSQAAAAAREIEKLTLAARHRVLSPGGESHRQYLCSMAEKTERLQRKYPRADLSRQRSYFAGELARLFEHPTQNTPSTGGLPGTRTNEDTPFEIAATDGGPMRPCKADTSGSSGGIAQPSDDPGSEAYPTEQSEINR